MQDVESKQGNTTSLKTIVVTSLSAGALVMVGMIAAIRLGPEPLESYDVGGDISDEMVEDIKAKIANDLIQRPANLPLTPESKISFFLDSEEGIDGLSYVKAHFIRAYNECADFNILVDHDHKTPQADIKTDMTVCPYDADRAYKMAPELPDDIQAQIKTELLEKLAQRPAYLPLKALSNQGEASAYSFWIEGTKDLGSSWVDAVFSREFSNCTIFNVDLQPYDNGGPEKPTLKGSVFVCPSPGY